MFQNYVVGISIIMAGNAAGMIAGITRGLTGVELGAARAQRALSSMAGRMALGGIALTLAGGALLGSMRGSVDLAERYVGLTNQLAAAGRSRLEIAEAERAAAEATARVPTVSRLNALAAISDILPTVNSVAEASRMVPQALQIQSVLRAQARARGQEISDEQAARFPLELARATGKFRGDNIEARLATTEALARGMMSQGGYITPTDIADAAAWIRTDSEGLSDEFLQGPFISLLSGFKRTRGGGSVMGTALDAFRRWSLVGQMNDYNRDYLDSIGLLNQNLIVRSRDGSVDHTPAGSIMGYEMARANPYQWATEFVLPALRNADVDINDADEMSRAIGQMAPNRLARMFLEELLMPQNRQRIERETALANRSLSISDAYQMYMESDPIMARQALAAQWENVQLELGRALLTPEVIQMFLGFARAIGEFAGFLARHPDLASKFAWLTVIVGGLALLSGVILVIGGVVAGIVAIVGGGVAGTVALVIGGIAAAIAIFLAVDWSGIYHWFAVKALQVTMWMWNLTHRIGAAISGLWSRFTSWVGQTTARVVQFFTDVKNAFLAQAPILFNALIAWFRDLPGRLSSSITQHIADNDLRNTGSYVGSGAERGVSGPGDRPPVNRSRSYVEPAKSHQKTIIINTAIQLDGREIGRAASRHIERETGRPQSGPSDYTPQIGFVPGRP